MSGAHAGQERVWGLAGARGAAAGADGEGREGVATAPASGQARSGFPSADARKSPMCMGDGACACTDATAAIRASPSNIGTDAAVRLHKWGWRRILRRTSGLASCSPRGQWRRDSLVRGPQRKTVFLLRDFPTLGPRRILHCNSVLLTTGTRRSQMRCRLCRCLSFGPSAKTSTPRRSI